MNRSDAKSEVDEKNVIEALKNELDEMFRKNKEYDRLRQQELDDLKRKLNAMRISEEGVTTELKEERTKNQELKREIERMKENDRVKRSENERGIETIKNMRRQCQFVKEEIQAKLDSM